MNDMTESPFLTELDLDQIQVETGLNHRRHFSGIDDLAESIQQHSLIQPLTVRATEDGYALVSGERRLRALRQIGATSAPVTVKNLSYEEARVVALVENIDREGITPGEEAEVAGDLLHRLNHDREATAKQLGWSRGKLDSRLALLTVAESVLQALAEKRISVGHAELFAQIPAESHDKTLEALESKGLSVSQFRAKIEQFAQHLSAAPFDTAECNGCPYNSSTQASLFETHLTEGQCSNRSCWNTKAKAAVESERAKLQDEYPVVWLASELSPNNPPKPVYRTGEEGVGPEQHIACQSCEHYGAWVDDKPGQEGQTTEGVCNNLDCRSEKIAAYKAVVAETSASAEPSTAPTTEGSASAAPASQSQAGNRASTGSGNKTAASNKPRQALTDHFDAEHRRIAAQHIGQHPESAWAMVLAQQVATAEHRGTEFRKRIGEDDPLHPILRGKGLTTGRSPTADLYQKVYALDTDQKHRLQMALASILLESDAGLSPLGLLQADAVDLTGQYDLTDEAFLKGLTTEALTKLLTDNGWDSWYDQQNGEGAFKQVAKRKGDLVAAVTASKDTFDWSRADGSGVRPEARWLK